MRKSLLLACRLLAAPVNAETVYFSYLGTASTIGALYGITTTSGSGSFTTADAANPAGMADLSSFNFTFTENTPSGTDTFNYALGDLQSFQATFGAGGTISALNLQTEAVGGFYTPTQYFVVTDLTSNGANTGDIDTGALSGGQVTITGVSAPAPTPGGGLGAAAALILAGLRRAVVCGVSDRRRENF